jgi:anti-sigma factor (TIGR02949 family)
VTEIPFDYKSCREAFGRLDDYLDRELTAGEMEGVRRHLEICVTCAEEFRIEAAVLTELRSRLRRVRMPPDAARRIHAALNRARATHQGP